MSGNTKDIIDFINESIKKGTLIAQLGNEENEIILNNGHPTNCGVDIRLYNLHAGGNWHVNDWQ